MPTSAAHHPAVRLLLLGVLVLLLAACAGRKADQRTEEGGAAPDPAQAESRSDAGPGASPGHPPPPAADDLDDYADVPAQPTISDPLERWNRFWFSLNDVLYTRLFQPLFNAYVYVTPQALRSGLRNAMVNALVPVRFVNSLLQGKFLVAGVEFGRFVLNSTLGMGGLINYAKDHKTIVPVDPEGEDFGQTLGVWGAGPGIYLVWPILGPSNVRDSVGRVVDMLTDPLLFVSGVDSTVAKNVNFIIGNNRLKQSSGSGDSTVNDVNLAVWAVLRFNAAGDTLDNYTKLKQVAVDPYIAMRDMYTKYRQSRIGQ